MKKRKPVRFTFTVPLPRYSVCVIGCCDESDAAIMAHKYLRGDGVDIEAGCMGWADSNKGRGAIYVGQKPKHDVITHECLHMANDILEYHGIERGTNGGLGELLAIIVDYLVGKVTDGLTRRGVKMKAR